MITERSTIEKVRHNLASGKYSAMELFQEYRKRIQELDDTYHAFITTTFAEAEAALQKADKELPLYAIPGSIKDNFNWKGTITSAGSKILANYRSPYNATVTKRLLDAGACLIGKTNMDAFAHGSSTETSDFFTTLNPLDKSRVAGGSSGGAAATVALGMSVYAIGSETAGSVRGPAAWCGVYGFIPTYGRFSRYGLIAMGSSLDRPGVITNSVKDAAILTEILSGSDRYDATSIPEVALKLTAKITTKPERLKIGLPRGYFDDRIDKETLSAVENALKMLEREGAELVELDLLDPKYSIAVYTIVQRSEVSSNLARIDGIRYGYFSEEEAETVLDQIALNRGEGFGHEAKQRSMTGAYTLSAGYYDAYYKKAQQVRTLIIEDFRSAFAEVDIIAGPTMPTTAPEIGVTKNNPLFGELTDVLNEPSALAGLPCISIPVGFDSKGLPIGMQLIGDQFAEEEVLRTAYLYESLGET